MPTQVGGCWFNSRLTRQSGAGKQVITVDPHNTSQACSECGQTVKKT
ncbi:transposase [Polycladomyces sp. WAk]|uniref:Transposase n=1 Tax=Polycladomyces zharkentensis TaxID=2807616 RepID=A0ABS2WKC3_9BACL|nr:transposase [Polycladomyces sp. WAk]